MANSDTHRAAHDAFNARDWDALARELAPDFTYVDQPRGITVKSARDFVDYLKGGWTTSFSDAAVTNPRYTDTADGTIARFEGRGINDGPLGDLPATGRQMILPLCEVMTLGPDGRMTAGELYYDQVTILVQLGHMPAPTS